MQILKKPSFEKLGQIFILQQFVTRALSRIRSDLKTAFLSKKNCVYHAHSLPKMVRQFHVTGVMVRSRTCALGTLHWAAIKSSPFYIRGNFVNCKPIQIIFGINIAEKL